MAANQRLICDSAELIDGFGFDVIDAGPLAPADGAIAVPTLPGLGVKPAE